MSEKKSGSGPELRKPDWLKIKLPSVEAYSKIKATLSKGRLHTICESGNCPNQGECWAAGTATFMILGENCTRNCRFCAVAHQKPLPVDPQEALKLAESVRDLNLSHVVITSVTRDDLPDEGAGHWANCVRKVREINPESTIEILVPDFHAREDCIDTVLDSKPEIFSHNVETVERITSEIRSGANYRRSLEVLRMASSKGAKTKSGFMLGLGEREDEIEVLLQDIYATGTEIVNLGQYLQPSRRHHSVMKYYTPDEFVKFRELALSIGFKHVESGPLVRSSYHAKNHL
jgi:lipoic acid synthetase